MPEYASKNFAQRLSERVKSLTAPEAAKLIYEELQLAYGNGRTDGFNACAEKVSIASGKVLAFDFGEND